MQRRFFPVFFFFLLLFGATVWPFTKTAKAETPPELYDADLQFVDALGETGYYLDMNSINIASDDDYSARVAIIRADENRLFLYQMRFIPSLRQYIINNTHIYSYDEKKSLVISDSRLGPLVYAEVSPLASIVAFIAFPRP